MASVLNFVIENWVAIFAILANVGHLFPAKTTVNKIADKISKNPDAIASIGKQVNDWSRLNK